MGNNQSENKKSVPQGQITMNISCTDDLMCQNIDSKRSKPGKDLVLVCPDAKCVAGKCECGPDCERDPYTGICCTEVEEVKYGKDQVNTYCIEDPIEKYAPYPF